MTKRVRTISYAWGDKYVRDFLDITLPALLADGNVPELARRFDVDFVFLTEEHQFTTVRGHESWRRLEMVCPARLVALDDLIVGHWYGISLSKTLVRGFKDLGASVLDTWLVFLNADFIIADGSYRALADRIDAGERLIFAPSYCVVREAVLPILRGYLSDGILAIKPRRMAEIGIPHRHYTIRAKTVNQRLFRIHRYDQFYYFVDEHTLLGRQMPIALVAMRPEKVLEDIDTFWDYGIVTEAAPTARHCVLGDSDEYQMIELRDERTFEELLQLGWPQPDEIARDLSSFTTKDQRDHLGYELIWHSGDLPPNLDQARASLAAFVDEVQSKLSAQPVSHLGHPFWSAAIGQYEQMRAEYLSRRAGKSKTCSGLLGSELRTDSEIQMDEPSDDAAVPVSDRTDSGLTNRVFGKVPFVKPWHPFWADLRHAERAIRDAKLPLDQARVLLVHRGRGVFERVALAAAKYRRVAPDSLLDGHAAQFAGDLTVTIEDPTGATRELIARRVRIAERHNRNIVPIIAAGETFDLCLCELEWDDITQFRDLFAEIRPHLAPGARVVVLHVDPQFDRRWRESSAAIRGCFPTDGSSDVLLSGTAGSRFARQIADRAGRANGSYRWLTKAGGMAIGALASRTSAASVLRQDPRKISRFTTSLTMVIDLP